MNRLPVGTIIDQLISKLGVKKYLVAEALGIKSTAFSNYLSNKRQLDFDQLIKAADYFGVSTDYLLGRTTQKNDLNNMVSEPRVEYGQPDANALAMIIKDLSRENMILEMQLKECLSLKEKNISSNIPVAKLG